MRWLVRGEVDGFFGLALDNLVQLLVIDLLCRTVLNFPPSLIYGRILPAVAVSLVVGNLYYAWQARALARATGRDDICALPYGINTVSLFAFIFLDMLPARTLLWWRGGWDWSPVWVPVSSSWPERWLPNGSDGRHPGPRFSRLSPESP